MPSQTSTNKIKSYLYDTLKKKLGTNHHRFLVERLAPYEKYDVLFNENIFEYNDFLLSNEAGIYEAKNFPYNCIIRSTLKTSGKLTFSERKTKNKHTCDVTFILQIFTYIGNEDFMCEIYDERKSILINFEQQIVRIIEEKKITNDQLVTESFDNLLEVTRKNKVIEEDDKNDIVIYKDIINCQNDIRYLLATLYLYKPYIQGFEEQHYADGNFYGYFPEFYDRHYLTNVSLLLQTVYNYWDKIGDLLHIYFTKESIEEHKVFFGSVIDKIIQNDPDIINNNAVKWFHNFHNCHYKELNRRRKQVVHYLDIKTEISQKHMEKLKKGYDIENLKKEIDDYPTYFRNHLKLCIEGFQYCVKIIDECYNKNRIA